MNGDDRTPSGQAHTFIGGMNVPSNLGYRLNATVPLAVLTVGASTLILHPRPFPIPMFSDFEVSLTEIAVAFPLGGSLLTSGVGIEVSDGQLAYFWTWRQQGRVLAALRHRGVPTDSAPRRAHAALRGQFAWLWSWKRPRAKSVATLPALSPLMIRLTPIFAIAGIAVAVLLALRGTPFGWIALAVGMIGAVQALRVWVSHRSAR